MKTLLNALNQRYHRLICMGLVLVLLVGTLMMSPLEAQGASSDAGGSKDEPNREHGNGKQPPTARTMYLEMYWRYGARTRRASKAAGPHRVKVNGRSLI